MRKHIFAVLSLLTIFFSCTKIETTQIGSGLIPPIDGVNVKDTFFDIVTNTFLDDNVARIYKSDDHVIGTINNDPLFGKTNASVFVELKPTFYPFFFTGSKDSLEVDSIVLVLGYRGTYGDSTMPQTWRVFEINQSDKLRFDSAYGAGSTNINYGAELGVKSNFSINSLDDSVNNRFENAKNQIRIKLNNSFATRLMKNYDSLGAYKNDSTFRENFAGFAVVPDPSIGNALIRVNLLDTNTKLSLYYKTRLATATRRDTLVSYFRFNINGGSQTSGSANIIKRQLGGSQLSNYINTGKNDSLVFVQTSPGTFATLRIPNLSKFRNVVVHRAEITALQAVDDPSLDAILSPPRYVLLSAYDSVNKRKINVRNDYEILSGGSNIANFGGFLIQKDLPGTGVVKAYNFTLTRYVQGIVTRKDSSYTLRMTAPSNDSLYYSVPYPASIAAGPAYISPGSANIIANGRVRLIGGGGQRQTRMRLRVIYSEL